MGLEDLRRPLREKMREMDSGLLALCISDRDGVPVLQCPLEGAKVEPLLRSVVVQCEYLLNYYLICILFPLEREREKNRLGHS